MPDLKLEDVRNKLIDGVAEWKLTDDELRFLFSEIRKRDEALSILYRPNSCLCDNCKSKIDQILRGEK